MIAQITNGETGVSVRTKLNSVINAVNSVDAYNVKLYGLVGDGVTNDREALNTLLNTTAPTGSTIYFPPGTYLIGSNIAVSNKQFTLLGYGNASVIKITANTQILNISSTAALASKWKFENLYFQGNDTGGNQAALYFSNNSGAFTVNNCWFSDFGYCGIAVANTETSDLLGGLISNSKFFSNNIGIDGSVSTRGEYLQILGCDFISNTKAIILAGGNCIVNACNINYNTNGIEVVTGTNNGHGIISNCNINHNATLGLNIHDTTLGMTISNNHMYESPIRIKDTTGVSITGGIIDVGSYTLDTNVGLIFSGVRFDDVYTNTITLTGIKPLYINCYNLDNRYAYDPDNFGSSSEAVVSTTNATVTTIQTIPCVASTTTNISGYVVARRTGGSAGIAEDGAMYRVEFTVKNAAGTATLIGSSIVVVGESQAGWDVTLTGSTSNILIQVTGAADNNINWKWVAVNQINIS